MTILSGINWQAPAIQIAFATSIILTIGVILFALVWSILTGQALNPTISNLIAFLLGGGLTATGGQLGVHHYNSGLSDGSALPSGTTT